MSRRTQAALALAAVIPIGLAVRFAPLHLPWVAAKYAGSTLWAIALYLFLGMLLPRLLPVSLGLLAAVLATMTELSRLIPIATVDAFRQTLAGKILLGRYFSMKNIAAYLVAIAAITLLDRALLPKRRERS